MQIRVLSTPELGDRSYVVSDGSTSVVIDPQRDLDRLEPVLEEAGAEVSHVLETHVHNDYVSGGHELARRTGAAYGVNAADDVAFERLGLADGQVLSAGSLRIGVLATPGHTPTHLSYVVEDLADPAAAPALFSGGSLLHGTVGRTDLVGAEHARDLAAAQHASAYRLATLAGRTTLHPTHGFGSFCAGGGGSGAESSTVADERRHNLALVSTSVEQFVDDLVASFTAYPAYYAHMAGLNRTAQPAVDLTAPLRPASPQEVQRLVAAGATVVDLRPAAAYAADHLPGTVSVVLGSQFATYVGWLAPWGRPLVVIGEDAAQLEEARRQLVRIGIDEITPAWGPLSGLAPAGAAHRSYPRATFDDLAADLAAGDVVVDVRRDDEHKSARIRGAVNLPLHELQARRAELPEPGTGGRLWVHCAAGFRSGTGASILQSLGHDVVHVDDAFDRAADLGLTDS